MGYLIFRALIALAIGALAWTLVICFLGDLFVVHLGMHRPWSGVDLALALPGLLVLALWQWRWGGGRLLAWVAGGAAYVWAFNSLHRYVTEWLLVGPAILIVCWMIWRHVRNVAAERQLAMDEQRLLRTAPLLSLTGRLWQQDRQR